MQFINLVNQILMGLRDTCLILSQVYDKTTTHRRPVLEFHTLKCDLSQKLFIAYYETNVVLLDSPAPLATIAGQYRRDDFNVGPFNHRRL